MLIGARHERMALLQLESLFAHSRDGAKCGPFGSALKKHEYVVAGIPVWTMNNVGANEFVEGRFRYRTESMVDEVGQPDQTLGKLDLGCDLRLAHGLVLDFGHEARRPARGSSAERLTSDSRSDWSASPSR